MRTTFVLLLALLAAGPASAAPHQPQPDGAHENEPVGERWDERWQGRRHWLYDDVEPGAATDGFAANAQGDCRHVTMRVKLPDGTTGVRRVRRCE